MLSHFEGGLHQASMTLTCHSYRVYGKIPHHTRVVTPSNSHMLQSIVLQNRAVGSLLMAKFPTLEPQLNWPNLHWQWLSPSG